MYLIQLLNSHAFEPFRNMGTLPPVINMPGALGTQAKHCTDTAAVGKLNVVMQ